MLPHRRLLEAIQRAPSQDINPIRGLLVKTVIGLQRAQEPPQRVMIAKAQDDLERRQRRLFCLKSQVAPPVLPTSVPAAAADEFLTVHTERRGFRWQRWLLNPTLLGS